MLRLSIDKNNLIVNIDADRRGTLVFYGHFSISVINNFKNSYLLNALVQRLNFL